MLKRSRKKFVFIVFSATAIVVVIGCILAVVFCWKQQMQTAKEFSKISSLLTTWHQTKKSPNYVTFMAKQYQIAIDVLSIWHVSEGQPVIFVANRLISEADLAQMQSGDTLPNLWGYTIGFYDKNDAVRSQLYYNLKKFAQDNYNQKIEYHLVDGTKAEFFAITVQGQPTTYSTTLGPYSLPFAQAFMEKGQYGVVLSTMSTFSQEGRQQSVEELEKALWTVKFPK